MQLPRDILSVESDHSSSVVERTLCLNKERLRLIALKIHEYAELAFQEFESVRLLCKFLEEHDFVVERGIAGLKTAFVATYSQGDGPTVSFNAVLQLRGY